MNFWKKRIVPILTICVILLFAFGVYALAAGTYGTEADPLVTLSYINDVVLKQLKGETETSVAEKLAELEADIKSNPSASASASAEYTVVTLTKGQTLTCQVGTEIIFRLGSAECAAPSSPGLIDVTSGSVLESGSALTKNHLYTVTVEGRGVKATDRTTLVVKGIYTIG